MPARNESHIDLQAALWTTLLDGREMSPTEEQDFHEWLEKPGHAQALTKYRSMVGMIQDLPKQKTADLFDIPDRHARFPFLANLFAHPVRLAAFAAAVVAAVAVGVWQQFPAVREYITQAYATGTGETRKIVLPDGSSAQLNTGSRVRWIGSEKDRVVVLERGEVLFDVAHDSSRPFRVIVGNSEIRDLATEFDVYRRSNGSVRVTVLSGQVSIKELAVGGVQPTWTERQLKPNQQIEYTQAGLIADVHSTDAHKSVLWLEGLLETEGLSLTTIVGELNRYSVKPILMPDPRLDAANIAIGGTWSIHDARHTLQRFQLVAPIVVTDTGDSYVLTYKADGSAPQQDTAGRQ